MTRADDKHDDTGNDNYAARGNHDLFPKSPVGKIHEFFLLDNVKRRENPERQSEEHQHKKYPGPEHSLIDSLGVRVTREELGIDVIPEVRASALRTDGVKDFILKSAPGTGERLFIVGHGVSVGFCAERLPGSES